MAGEAETYKVTENRHVPEFDGDPKHFVVWWRRFRGYAGINKFKEAIGDKRDPYMPEREDTVLNLNTGEGKKKAKAVQQNAMAMHNLSNAFTSEALGTLLDEACSEEWPDGEAYKVIKAVKKKYQHSDDMAAVEIRNELSQIHMKPYEDPSVLFEQIINIRG